MLGLVEAAPMLVALLYGEWYTAAGLLAAGLLTSSLGWVLRRTFRTADELLYSHGLIISAAGWMAIALMGSLPFLIIAWITPPATMNGFIPEGAGYNSSSLMYFRSPLHCFFESMSAYTTTGLSMAVHEPSIGKGLLFYRSFAQWAGGAGFIIMVLAVFRQSSGRNTVLLFGSEGTGERLKPKVLHTARAIWRVYLYVTAFSMVYLWIGTRIILPDYPIADAWFDAVNHAMAGQSTGGFSPLDDSIATYGSPWMDVLLLLPMVLGSFSLPFYYKVLQENKWSEIWNDIQTRALLFAFVLGGLGQALLLIWADRVPHPVREGVFQFISGISTTGWQTSNIGQWDWVSIAFIVFTGMFIGGASGSTVGGIKVIRALLITKGIRWQISRAFLSRQSIQRVTFNGQSLRTEEMNEEFARAASFAILFLLMLIGCTMLSMLFL
ncbi:MAG TPA: potassium transporter TrkG, partial [Bacteroidales bacterium]|nr:potassium transporter TrkG [Bacteroidales bacterium]